MRAGLWGALALRSPHQPRRAAGEVIPYLAAGIRQNVRDAWKRTEAAVLRRWAWITKALMVMQSPSAFRRIGWDEHRPSAAGRDWRCELSHECRPMPSRWAAVLRSGEILPGTTVGARHQHRAHERAGP